MGNCGSSGSTPNSITCLCAGRGYHTEREQTEAGKSCGTQAGIKDTQRGQGDGTTHVQAQGSQEQGFL